MNILTQVISNIKIIKLNAWEGVFEKLITKARKSEMWAQFINWIYSGLFLLVLYILPFLLKDSIFAIYLG